MELAIVITAYNRAAALSDLLSSLKNVKPVDKVEKVPLIISIDNNGTSEVNKIAQDFTWHLGEKQVIIHPEKLGLVKHFIWTGDQTERYNHVIFLEDDLIVSPDLINYCSQLIEYYDDDDRVAAASLYNPVLNEATGTKFYQLDDGSDVYFLQQPYWGNIWFKNKWREFKIFMESYHEKPEILPSKVAGWKASFKKKYVQYLIESGRTVVTPRISIVSNNGCAGLHNSNEPYMYQTVIRLGKEKYDFIELGKSDAVYDVFEEVKPEILKKYNKNLSGYDFECDLNGTKHHIKKEYVLTSKRVKNSIFQYTSLMKPTEQGVVFNLLGNGEIALAKTTDVIEDVKYYRDRKFKDIQKNYSISTNSNTLRILWRMTKKYIMKKFKAS